MSEVRYFKWCKVCDKVTEHLKDYEPFVDRPPNLFCMVCCPWSRNVDVLPFDFIPDSIATLASMKRLVTS